MKKTKLLMPILGVGAVAATVAPMVAMAGCTKVEIGEFSVVQEGTVQVGGSTLKVILTWNEFEKDGKNTIKVTNITGSIILGDESLTFANLESQFDDINTGLKEKGSAEIKIEFEGGKTLSKAGTYKGNLTLQYSEESTETITYTINGFNVVVTAKK